MFCLVYKSVASPAFDKAAICEMLEKAKKSNQKKNITGCLIYYQGEFLQYLEGRQLTVLELYDKIKLDDRHHDVELISHSHIEEREFENWDMAYEDFFGDNDQLQFLRLLVSSYLESPQRAMDPNPTSGHFWRTTKRLLQTNTSERSRS